MSQDLKNKLIQLKNAEKLNLADEYIGDQGAKLVADYLRTNRYIKVIQLKGNDLGPRGISQIFDALQQSQSISSVQCEWNKIGIDTEGINAVAGFIAVNKSIQHLSLSNNSISGEDIGQLANSLRNSSLLSLDLKWNSLGSQGGQVLKKVLDHNQTLLYLELNGNNISEDIIDQIEDKIKLNRRHNNIPKERIVGQVDDEEEGSQQASANKSQHYPEREQERRFRPEQFQDSDGLGTIHHLENVLQQERLHTAQIKQRLESELEDLERKDKNDLRTIQDLESKVSDVQNQNKMMKFDIERLRDEFAIIDKSHGDQVKTYEDRIRQNQFLVDEMEKKHRMNCERMLTENNYRIKELARDWESRCRNLEERIKAAELEKENQEDELKRIEQKSIDIKIRQDSELDELTRRVQEEEFQKYQSNLANLEARIVAVEEGHNLYLKRNGDLIQEYEKRDKEGNVEIAQYKSELEKLEEEHEKFIQSNANFKQIAEKLKSELNIKEGAVAKLESEINSINQQIESKKHFGKEQLEHTKEDQGRERKQWEDEREEQLKAIHELEQKLRESHLDNTRLRQEYLRLSEVVQANVNKEIFSTFTNNNYY